MESVAGKRPDCQIPKIYMPTPSNMVLSCQEVFYSKRIRERDRHTYENSNRENWHNVKWENW